MTKQKKKRKKRPHKRVATNLGLHKYFSIYASPLEKKLDAEFAEYIANLTNNLVDEFLNRMIKCDEEFENKVNIRLKNYRNELNDPILDKIDEFLDSNMSFENFENIFTKYLISCQLDVLDYLHNGYIEIGDTIINNSDLGKIVTEFTSNISDKLKELVIYSPTELLHSRLVTRATTATKIVEVNLKHLVKYTNAGIKDLLYNYYVTFSGILLETFRSILCAKGVYGMEFKIPKVIEEQENIPKEYKHRTWRELNAIAVNRGYKLDRYNGDHAIYMNSNGKVVIIPQGRDIGKGLQIAILKDIENS